MRDTNGASLNLHLRKNRDLAALSLIKQSKESFVLSVLNSSPDCIKLIELDGRLSFMNHNGMCAMEIEDFSLIENSPWPDMWPEDARDMLEGAIREGKAGRATDFRAFCPTAKGVERWWQVTVSPVISSDGHVQRLLATSRDVTNEVTQARRARDAANTMEKQIAEQDLLIAQKEVLMREIDHRVKNGFSLIIGMLRMQARETHSDEARSQILDAAQRIQTLTEVHAQLYADPTKNVMDLAAYLKRLIDDLSDATGGAIYFRNVAGAPLQQKGDRALAIGFVTTELCTNARKHGGPDCRIEVELDIQDNRTFIRLSVLDDGPGLPEGFKLDAMSGLGMKICQIYASQVDGTVSAENRPGGGANFTLVCPID
ncbi:MAG: histidine kinase dimerization/phosphoacceptor domain -containing protein [Pseudomonadota bacterium]